MKKMLGGLLACAFLVAPSFGQAWVDQGVQRRGAPWTVTQSGGTAECMICATATAIAHLITPNPLPAPTDKKHPSSIKKAISDKVPPPNDVDADKVADAANDVADDAEGSDIKVTGQGDVTGPDGGDGSGTPVPLENVPSDASQILLIDDVQDPEALGHAYILQKSRRKTRVFTVKPWWVTGEPTGTIPLPDGSSIPFWTVEVIELEIWELMFDSMVPAIANPEGPEIQIDGGTGAPPILGKVNGGIRIAKS